MRFRSWIESDSGLNAGFPEVLSQVNKADSVPASAEVVNTGLQPQVGSEEIQTDVKDEQDKIQSIDSAIQQIDSKINSNTASEKINKFAILWNKLKKNWEKLKIEKDGEFEQVKINGLGGSTGDLDKIAIMQQQPNSSLNDKNTVESPLR